MSDLLHLKYNIVKRILPKSRFSIQFSPVNDWRNLNRLFLWYMVVCLVVQLVGQSQCWKVMVVQVIQSFSSDVKTIKYAELLECWNTEVLKCCSVESMKCWNAARLKLWNAEMMKYWNIEHWNTEMLQWLNDDMIRCWKVEMLKFRNAKIMKYWNVKIWKFLTAEILKSWNA